jgi:hypothetical protein
VAVPLRRRYRTGIVRSAISSTRSVSFALMMRDDTLTLRDAEDILGGDARPGRHDLSDVRELADFIRAAGEAEPPPPMSDALLGQIADRTP